MAYATPGIEKASSLIPGMSRDGSECFWFGEERARLLAAVDGDRHGARVAGAGGPGADRREVHVAQRAGHRRGGAEHLVDGLLVDLGAGAAGLVVGLRRVRRHRPGDGADDGAHVGGSRRACALVHRAHLRQRPALEERHRAPAGLVDRDRRVADAPDRLSRQPLQVPAGGRLEPDAEHERVGVERDAETALVDQPVVPVDRGQHPAGRLTDLTDGATDLGLRDQRADVETAEQRVTGADGVRAVRAAGRRVVRGAGVARAARAAGQDEPAGQSGNETGDGTGATQHAATVAAVTRRGRHSPVEESVVIGRFANGPMR